MKLFLIWLIISSCALAQIASELEIQNGIPKWLVLGDDNDLQSLYSEKSHVLLVCVYDIEITNKILRRYEVSLKCTVVKSYKGSVITGEKIKVTYETDAIPQDYKSRTNYLAELRSKINGDLLIAFLMKEENSYFTQSIYLPKYTKSMSEFIHNLKNPGVDKTTSPE